MAGGLQEVRDRISSVQNTMQITSAMKMVSAAKLRRAQDAITQMRPYAVKLQAMLANVSASLDQGEGVYSTQREVKKVLVIAITSNRGLCGAFNNNIVKLASKAIQDAKDAGQTCHVLPLGKKALDAANRLGWTKAEGYGQVATTLFDNLDFTNVSEVANKVMAQFVSGAYDEVVLAYNQFKNAAAQIATHEPFLPMLPEAVDQGAAVSTDYIFEPNKEEIVERMLPNALRVQLYKALLDSHAAEHGARMTAMHQATDNGGDLLRDLRITYNKARQASITTEILEIVAGSEALDG
ncbi:MAG: ATP synthase F1 subunit gamma [Bacteroidetes bacterium]|nr:ATP synthase F1 subunit gamma [Bacteroidota bacterium]MDA0903835.1 ATP synthase F1 subunit gamma [Bacteroidota bacterium]MDA1242871.1 ATP synthase F1 subunit gamma [Bacteroidota bacterium]